jgi:hypothetical protein
MPHRESQEPQRRCRGCFRVTFLLIGFLLVDKLTCEFSGFIPDFTVKFSQKRLL